MSATFFLYPTSNTLVSAANQNSLNEVKQHLTALEHAYRNLTAAGRGYAFSAYKQSGLAANLIVSAANPQFSRFSVLSSIQNGLKEYADATSELISYFEEKQMAGDIDIKKLLDFERLDTQEKTSLLTSVLRTSLFYDFFKSQHGSKLADNFWLKKIRTFIKFDIHNGNMEVVKPLLNIFAFNEQDLKIFCNFLEHADFDLDYNLINLIAGDLISKLKAFNLSTELEKCVSWLVRKNTDSVVLNAKRSYMLTPEAIKNLERFCPHLIQEEFFDKKSIALRLLAKKYINVDEINQIIENATEVKKNSSVEALDLIFELLKKHAASISQEQLENILICEFYNCADHQNIDLIHEIFKAYAACLSQNPNQMERKSAVNKNLLGLHFWKIAQDMILKRLEVNLYEMHNTSEKKIRQMLFVLSVIHQKFLTYSDANSHASTANNLKDRVFNNHSFNMKQSNTDYVLIIQRYVIMKCLLEKLRPYLENLKTLSCGINYANFELLLVGTQELQDDELNYEQAYGGGDVASRLEPLTMLEFRLIEEYIFEDRISAEMKKHIFTNQLSPAHNSQYETAEYLDRKQSGAALLEELNRLQIIFRQKVTPC